MAHCVQRALHTWTYLQNGMWTSWRMCVQYTGSSSSDYLGSISSWSRLDQSFKFWPCPQKQLVHNFWNWNWAKIPSLKISNASQKKVIKRSPFPSTQCFHPINYENHILPILFHRDLCLTSLTHSSNVPQWPDFCRTIKKKWCPLFFFFFSSFFFHSIFIPIERTRLGLISLVRGRHICRLGWFTFLKVLVFSGAPDFS